MEPIGSHELLFKDYDEQDKPENKILLYGKMGLSDAEVLSLVLGYRGNENPVDIARALLKKCNNSLDHLAKMNFAELLKFGVKRAAAYRIIGAFEIGKRRVIPEGINRKLTSSKDAVDMMQPLLGDLMHEEFWVIFLNRANHIIGKRQMSIGGMSGTVADPRTIFKSALDHRAISIILCHNHPSGNNQPSSTDIQLTKNLSEAGKVLEITVLDHVIITQQSFYSFADEGLI